MSLADEIEEVTHGLDRALARSRPRTVREGNFFSQALRDRADAANANRVREPDAVAKWEAVFDSYGPDWVYENIAHGLRPAALARANQWPITLFVGWWNKRRDPKLELQAQHAAADVAAVDQDLVYDDPSVATSPSAASAAKARAEAKRWMAERQNPDRWGPPQASIPEQGQVVINLSIDGNNAPKGFVESQNEKRLKKLSEAPQVFNPKLLEVDAEDA